MRTKLVVRLKRVKNSAMGSPRYKVVDTNNIDALEALIDNRRYFKNLKNGVHTVPNTSFSYAICDALTVDIPKHNIIIMTKIV